MPRSERCRRRCTIASAAAEALLAEGRRSEADLQLAQALAFYQSVGATRYILQGKRLVAAAS